MKEGQNYIPSQPYDDKEKHKNRMHKRCISLVVVENNGQGTRIKAKIKMPNLLSTKTEWVWQIKYFNFNLVRPSLGERLT